MDPLFFFLLGHIFGDYALQTDRMAQSKHILNGYLVLHGTLYMVMIAAAALVHDLFYNPAIFSAVLPWLVPLMILHIVQDLVKAKYFKKSRQVYYLDQALHLAALYALRIVAGG
jgi:hypothetical protein